ncbi:MAG: ParB N-terminal domain-containing protein [Lentisphaeria bacterium]|nr:ParB N-terminal domain-containing protein [Lentisphaeria bacterium]
MEVVYLSPDDLIPYSGNAKQHPPEQVERIANSIKAFGWQQPIVVDKDRTVIIGHGRLFAAKELLLDKVPVVFADNLTEDQVNALRLADNKTNESAWDFGKLEEELAELSIAGFDMEQFGFGDLSDLGGAVPDNLDAEEDEDRKISVKFTFPDFRSYAPHENELKQVADDVGAVFGLVKT